MSQADLHTDSSSSEPPLPPADPRSLPPSDPRIGVPPPPQPNGSNGRQVGDGIAASSAAQSEMTIPPAPAPQQVVPPPPAHEVGDSEFPATVPALPSVPPPPPARATLPPVRPAPEPRVASGVGSAKGMRWRGELEEIEQRAGKKKYAATHPGAAASQLGLPDGDEYETVDEDFHDSITKEAPSWLVSTVIHLVLLLILALINSPAGTGISRVLLKIGQVERESPAELTEFAIDSNDVIAESIESIEDSEVEIDVSTIFETANMSNAVDLATIDLGAGEPLEVLKPMFNGRTGAMKQALLAIYGGTPETQEAVALGLAWLKRNQQRGGNWSMQGPYGDGGISENQTAATAMALLAFLGDGNTHLKGPYQGEVERGIKWLVAQQDRSGFMAKQSRGHEKMYAQAQGTIAMCELYAMTGDSWLRDRAQLALDFAMRSQSSEGGWRYEPKFDSDTSVTGWFVMALQSGRGAGLEVDNSILSKVEGYLDNAQTFEDGAAYAYQIRGNPSPAMTAEGLLCRQYLGWYRDHPGMARGIKALLSDAPFVMNDQDVYYWYYATQMLHHYGGDPWRAWNEKMREELPKAQVKSGRESGSWAPQRDRWGRNSGRLYTTCLSIYCLEVYYRHMPLYSANAKE